MLNQLRPLYQTTDRLKKVWINGAHMTEGYDLYHHRYSSICVEIILGLPWEAAKPHRCRWKSNTQGIMVHMKTFIGCYREPPSLLHPPLSLHSPCLALLRAIESLWFWRARAAVPVVPAVGRGHYYNPILPVHRTNVVITISPKRSVISSQGFQSHSQERMCVIGWMRSLLTNQQLKWNTGTFCERCIINTTLLPLWHADNCWGWNQ